MSIAPFVSGHVPWRSDRRKEQKKTPAGIRAGGGFDFGLLCALPLRRGHNDYAYCYNACAAGRQWRAVEAVEHDVRVLDIYAVHIMHECPESPQQRITQLTRGGSGPY
jgi:hypothetical protein